MVCANFVHTAADGRTYQGVEYYNLDMIISVGYRVNSKRGIAFRNGLLTYLKNV
ncbi:RhuM family protein [Rickettsia peacockii]|uniref:RhuM family protein n=1 Tax=Rickettsia peacockii TaxID=47589 RepID=UPI001E2C2B53|nr:RhuM family protein [Rickettsia peacockii]